MGLVLTRRIGESIVIGNDVEVRIKGVNGQQVKLDIDAPLSTHIDRKETRIKKDREKQQNARR